jgi:hypothetical protein
MALIALMVGMDAAHLPRVLAGMITFRTQVAVEVTRRKPGDRRLNEIL